MLHEFQRWDINLPHKQRQGKDEAWGNIVQTRQGKPDLSLSYPIAIPKYGTNHDDMEPLQHGKENDINGKSTSIQFAFQVSLLL